MVAQQAHQAAPDDSRRPLKRALAMVFVVAVLAAPFVLIGSDFSMLGTSTDETLHTLLRFCALMGISLLLLQVVSGAYRPTVRRLFQPATAQGFHTACGVTGLAFVICHFVFMVPSLGEHWTDLSHGFFVLGPLMLLVLLATIGTALTIRRSSPRLFSRLHILNYLVFTVGAIHAMGIGTQGSTPGGRALLGVYLIIGLSGLAYRASSPAWRRRLAPARAAR